MICTVKNMFKFSDKWGRRIRGKLIEVFVCIGVIVSVIVGIVQIKRKKGMSIGGAFESDLMLM